jgi:hypothetical protein
MEDEAAWRPSTYHVEPSDLARPTRLWSSLEFFPNIISDYRKLAASMLLIGCVLYLLSSVALLDTHNVRHGEWGFRYIQRFERPRVAPQAQERVPTNAAQKFFCWSGELSKKGIGLRQAAARW